MVNTAFTFQSGDLHRCHNQAGFHITTGHIAHAALEMHVCLSPDFLAFTIWLITRKWMLCWSLVHLKRKGNLTRGLKLLFLHWFCLSFQLKTNDTVTRTSWLEIGCPLTLITDEGYIQYVQYHVCSFCPPLLPWLCETISHTGDSKSWSCLLIGNWYKIVPWIP